MSIGRKKKIGTFLSLSLLLIQLQEQYLARLDPFFTLSLFLVCRGLNGWLLLLLCRISRALSFLVCLMMTCTHTQGIRIQADDDDAHIRMRLHRHCHLCRACRDVCVRVSNFTRFLLGTRCSDVTCQVHFHPNHHHHHMLFSHILQSMSFISHLFQRTND